MPLTTALSLTLSESWALSVANTSPFQPTRQGTDSASFSWSGVDTSTVNQLFANVYTLAGSAHTDIDLTSLTGTSGFDLST